MTAHVEGNYFCSTDTWSESVWLVGLVSDRNGLTVSTAPDGSFLVSVTFTVWKIGSASFSKVLATNIPSSCENISDHLAPYIFQFLTIKDFGEFISLFSASL